MINKEDYISYALKEMAVGVISKRQNGIPPKKMSDF